MSLILHTVSRGNDGLIPFPDELACGGDLRAEFRRIQDFDLARFAEDPADDLMLKSGLERDYEGAIGLRFDLELFHVLVFTKIKSDTGIAAQTDAADPGVYEQAVFTSVLNQLLVGNEGVARERDIV